MSLRRRPSTGRAEVQVAEEFSSLMRSVAAQVREARGRRRIPARPFWKLPFPLVGVNCRARHQHGSVFWIDASWRIFNTPQTTMSGFLRTGMTLATATGALLVGIGAEHRRVSCARCRDEAVLMLGGVVISIRGSRTALAKNRYRLGWERRFPLTNSRRDSDALGRTARPVSILQLEARRPRFPSEGRRNGFTQPKGGFFEGEIAGRELLRLIARATPRFAAMTLHEFTTRATIPKTRICKIANRRRQDRGRL
jgi:hypothetical protein